MKKDASMTWGFTKYKLSLKVKQNKQSVRVWVAGPSSFAQSSEKLWLPSPVTPFPSAALSPTLFPSLTASQSYQKLNSKTKRQRHPPAVMVAENNKKKINKKCHTTSGKASVKSPSLNRYKYLFDIDI